MIWQRQASILKVSMLVLMVNFCGVVSAQLIPKKSVNPIEDQTNNLINNLTVGTMELSNTNSALSNKHQVFTAKPGIIILSNGAKLTGFISPNDYGYRINHNQGSQIIPFEYVSYVGSSLEDVYQKVILEYPQPTLADHLRIAKQCHAWGYPEGAKEQLKLAVIKDENHPEIKQLADLYFPKKSAAEVEQASHSGSTSSSITRQIANYRKLHNLNETAGGKSPPLPSLDYEQSREFSLTIQPILQARCGNARCHGGVATQEFHIDWIARDQPVSRKRLEDNLRSFLAQVNREEPAKSPLVTKIHQEDGMHGSKIWKDALTQKNQITLLEFVYALDRSGAGSKQKDMTKSPTLHQLPDNGLPDLKPVPTTKSTGMVEQNILQVSGENKQDQTKDTAWDRFQRGRVQDAFDPGQFNQK